MPTPATSPAQGACAGSGWRVKKQPSIEQIEREQQPRSGERGRFCVTAAVANHTFSPTPLIPFVELAAYSILHVIHPTRILPIRGCQVNKERVGSLPPLLQLLPPWAHPHGQEATRHTNGDEDRPGGGGSHHVGHITGRSGPLSSAAAAPPLLVAVEPVGHRCTSGGLILSVAWDKGGRSLPIHGAPLLEWQRCA